MGFWPNVIETFNGNTIYACHEVHREGSDPLQTFQTYLNAVTYKKTWHRLTPIPWKQQAIIWGHTAILVSLNCKADTSLLPLDEHTKQNNCYITGHQWWCPQERFTSRVELKRSLVWLKPCSAPARFFFCLIPKGQEGLAELDSLLVFSKSYSFSISKLPLVCLFW